MARTGSSLPRGIDWIPVDVALANLRATMPVLDETERVVVDDATERVPANDLLAARDNPPGSNAAVDGYGFVHQGGGGRRNLVRGSSVPGAPYAGVIGDGQAVRILTGARIPPGVDTVVMEENTRVAHGVLTMTDCPDPGANIRIAGEDFRYGDTVFGKGKRLGINDLATLAATGMQEIDVIRRPRIGVLSTGDELIEARFDTDSYDTVDMNRPVLLAMIRQWGFEARDLGRIRDDAASLRQVLGSVAGNLDAVLTTGGASASEQDHVSALLKAEGSHHLWRIAMKPGRPLVMAHWQGMPILGLPGNPVAAFVCALIFAYPALCHLAGETWPVPVPYRVPAAFEKSKRPGRREYLRARLTKGGAAEIYPSEGSGLTTGLAWSEGLVELGDAAMNIRPGDPVCYLPYGSFRLGT